jgi:hypothetical protein
MKSFLTTLCLLLTTAACSTLPRSLALGGAGGVAIGAYAGSAVYAGPQNQIKTRNTVLGAGIGLGVGLLTSYLLHGHVQDRMRLMEERNDERLRFGDLPANPFSPDFGRDVEMK